MARELFLALQCFTLDRLFTHALQESVHTLAHMIEAVLFFYGDEPIDTFLQAVRSAAITMTPVVKRSPLLESERLTG